MGYKIMKYYVYLVHSIGKRYKIGYTNNLKRRQREYNTCNHDAYIIEYIEVDTEIEGRAIESQLHDEIQALYNVREWFICKGRQFSIADLQTAYGYTIHKRVKHRA